MTEGQIGRPPDWYLVIRAARYLRVPPWHLVEQPVTWRDWALAAEAAEFRARTEAMKRTRS